MCRAVLELIITVSFCCVNVQDCFGKKGIDHGKLQYAGLVMKKVMKMEATRLHFKHDEATQKAMMRINICTFNCISCFL